ncbi:hypothetical protein JI721_08295 [Alicyclobacillus cycloheptanicus]|uniref:CcmD family protein n=1 Tax=Alicyclobacillus cycloheptanicus TaxID=1457 RepID=A0ABT9XLD8_9BACL|nr:hypothetical protein [Alicyclobacillus cycloheptanicus]MDQ0191121.1 hypothetical protein [Alicyclobacillus cycloheptanicus]WDM02742.1 hypothetical protein JI721_08295 [Alicyclobacillus cycloheptanicus]
MGPHGSWMRAFHEALGHTVYWIAAFVILAGAIAAYVRIDQRRKEAEASRVLYQRARRPGTADVEVGSLEPSPGTELADDGMLRQDASGQDASGSPKAEGRADTDAKSIDPAADLPPDDRI